MSVYSDILVAIDLSENSIPPLKEALKFSRQNADVTCLHVVPESGEEAKSFRNFYNAIGAEESILENYAMPWLENWLSDVDIDIPESVELEARVGDPSTVLLEEAEQGNYDLLIVGTHGRRGMKRYWMGSVAEEIIRQSPCPVLAVRAQNPNPEIIED